MTISTALRHLACAGDKSISDAGRRPARSGRSGLIRNVLIALPLVLATSALAGPPPRHMDVDSKPAVLEKRQAVLPARASHRVAVRITPLHWAAIEGDTAKVQEVLEAGADVNATEDLFGGERALHWAAYTGRPAVVRALIAAGAEIDARDDSGETAVREAVRAADPAYAALVALLVAGADPEARSLSGNTALHEAVGAIDARPEGAVYFLRLFGADPNATDDQGATALHYAVLQPWDRFTGATLTATPIDPHQRSAPLDVARLDAKDNDGQTPLHWIASKLASAADRRVVKWLLSQGVDVNAADEHGSTPLDWAEFNGLDGLAGILRSAGGATMQSPPSDNP